MRQKSYGAQILQGHFYMTEISSSIYRSPREHQLLLMFAFLKVVGKFFMSGSPKKSRSDLKSDLLNFNHPDNPAIACSVRDASTSAAPSLRSGGCVRVSHRRRH